VNCFNSSPVLQMNNSLAANMSNTPTPPSLLQYAVEWWYSFGLPRMLGSVDPVQDGKKKKT
jgi:hypothetical protein